MKKLIIVVLVFFTLSVSVNAQKTSKLFVELTRVMTTSHPSGTAEYQKLSIPYWQIDKGNFVYITEKQLFQGEYKFYNFSVSSKKTGFSWMGVDVKATNKEKRQIEKELLKAIKAKR
ncbi:MAG TPA: hypothetical protein VIK86_05025 [Candidatus Paceibacterota bacterium]